MIKNKCGAVELIDHCGRELVVTSLFIYNIRKTEHKHLVIAFNNFVTIFVLLLHNTVFPINQVEASMKH